MLQMKEHLTQNKIISPNHHRSVQGRSTQTLLLELHDKLLQILEQDDEDAALILLDQSKAHDLALHNIFLDKLDILNYLPMVLVTEELLEGQASICRNPEQRIRHLEHWTEVSHPREHAQLPLIFNIYLGHSRSLL